MEREIGSEFWINEVVVDSEVKTPEWLSKFGDVTLTSSGRAAISLMLENLDIVNKTALLPAYLCESVVMPFIKRGFDCQFYDVGASLDIGYADDLLEFSNIGIFLHMGYFGFNTNSGLNRVISHFRERSAVIVEDVTHTLFSDYERSIENDFYIGSIRKWIGIPSGGFLASKKRLDNVALSKAADFAQIRKEALFLKGEYIETNNFELKEIFLRKFSEAEEILDNVLDPSSMDELSLQILSQLDVKDLVERRRLNYTYLQKNLLNIKSLEVLLNIVDERTCPFFFPVLIKKKREEVRTTLIDNKVYCPVHWPIPEHIQVEEYKNAGEIFNSELSLPCDQRYGIEDMSKVVSIIRSIAE